MPPTDRPGPVQPTESVYRRINVCYYSRNNELSVSPQAFKPTGDDEYGISVVRTDFTSKPADALCRVDVNKLNSYHVASIPVQEFITLSLSVVEDALLGEPDLPDVPGHALVSELNTIAYRSRKQEMLDKMVELAKIASRNIVHSPPDAMSPT